MCTDPEKAPRLSVRIHAQLARRIRDGEFPTGTKVPIEAELAGEYGCDVDSVRRAQQLLQADGLAERWPGKGHYSSGPEGGQGSRTD